VLPLMETDFFQVIKHIYDGSLDGYEIKWKKGSCCCVVAASHGYPGKYETGFEITGYDQVASKVYSAGTVFKNGKLISSGGRVLNVSSLGDNLLQARQKAYMDLAKIKFENIYYRNDIGG
ncbi:MAG TPA: phosphoribosylglycinamide synthetase C domain-containing protein, partial [Petrotogaceae bacterium]|nr:phosphoribosylglycinamide synthetase C domain-containing protein [Petrotogaceae bacterium]